METMVFIRSTWNDKIDQWDVTTNVTKSVFTTTDMFSILPFVETAVVVEGKVKLAANYDTVFWANDEIAFIGRPETMRDFNMGVN